MFIIISKSAGSCSVPKTNSSVRLREGSDVLDVVGQILSTSATWSHEIKENMLDGTCSKLGSKQPLVGKPLSEDYLGYMGVEGDIKMGPRWTKLEEN